MSTQSSVPARLASEDVIISAPLSYAGSAQRIMRVRRGVSGNQLIAVTTAAVVLIVLAWTFITAWYLLWGFWLVPFRLMRRGARKRKLEAMRHRELLGTIQGSAAASAGAIVTATIDGGTQTTQPVPSPTTTPTSPSLLIGDAEREQVIRELHHHLIAGRLTTEEYEERLSTAHRARRSRDIEAVRADLPALPPPPASLEDA